MLLKGVLDCPDLPLNVSRSFLQNDGYVKKISAHITKKVSDKLTSLFENDRENYSKYWEDINPFVKYGCIRESKFFERMNKAIIYKSTNGDYVTLEEYLERNKEKHENKVFYVTDEGQQIQYINLFKEHGMEALILGTLIDNHFIQFLEMKESNIKFSRIDADLSDSLKDASEPDADDKGMNEKLEKLFKDSLNKEKLKIQVEGLKTDSISALMLLSEESRRMQEMSKMFGGMNMPNMFSPEETLVLNSRNILIRQLVALMDREDRKEDIKMLCEQVYDLAVMSHRQLEPEAMTRFIERSNKIMEKLASE